MSFPSWGSLLAMCEMTGTEWHNGAIAVATQANLDADLVRARTPVNRAVVRLRHKAHLCMTAEGEVLGGGWRASIAHFVKTRFVFELHCKLGGFFFPLSKPEPTDYATHGLQRK